MNDAHSHDEDLAVRRVLVTGGTSGLGLAMASALAQKGAAIAVAGRNGQRAKAVAESLGETAIGVELDVRDASSVAIAVEEAWRKLGGLDMLINNAGIGMRTVNPRFLTEPKEFWTVPVDAFREVIDVNLTGYFRVAREVVPRMLGGDGGRVVNISMNHSTMNRRGFVPYGPSRAGAEALSRIMAADLRGASVTVNLLLPGGPTMTGMVPHEDRPASIPFLDASIMGPPIVWLASRAATGVHDERIVAKGFEQWLEARTGRA